MDPVSARPSEARPARISIALIDAVPDAHGVIHVTPDCVTLDDLDACIRALQDDLERLRGHARRVFTGALGHA